MSARFNLELSIASATNLKNVNEQNGGALKPYAVLGARGGSQWITGIGTAIPSPSGGNSYSWREKINIQVTTPMEGSTLDIDFFHETSLGDNTGNIWAGSAHFDLGRLKLEIRAGGVSALRTEKVMHGTDPEGEVAVYISIHEVGCHVAHEGCLPHYEPMEFK